MLLLSLRYFETYNGGVCIVIQLTLIFCHQMKALIEKVLNLKYELFLVHFYIDTRILYNSQYEY